MKKWYTVINKNSFEDDEYIHTSNVYVEEVGECPCCHFATSPTFINGFMFESEDDQIPPTLFLILYCTKCHNIYIAKYISNTYNDEDLGLIFVFPQQTACKIYSDNIIKLSPEFVSIYNQALEAEANINTQGLAGLGYRKSLEFLIKDYLIKLKHKDKNSIQKMELGNCINLLDKDLQDIAKASVWLGNDEVHYFRKNKNYDVKNLKDFIDCLVTDIEREYIRIKAHKFVNSK